MFKLHTNPPLTAEQVSENIAYNASLVAETYQLLKLLAQTLGEEGIDHFLVSEEEYQALLVYAKEHTTLEITENEIVVRLHGVPVHTM